MHCQITSTNLDFSQDVVAASLDDVQEPKEREAKEDTQGPFKLPHQGVKQVQQHFLVGHEVCWGVEQGGKRFPLHFQLERCSNNRVLVEVARKFTPCNIEQI